MRRGASLAVILADSETGEARLERYAICHDVGRVVNPQIVDGQLVGAAVQGLAGALLEELAYDERGQPLSISFMDYAMPTAAEAPSVEATALEFELHSAASANPLGVKGCAESGIIGAGAAVANALADALDPDGDRIRSLPLTPEGILSLIRCRRVASP